MTPKHLAFFFLCFAAAALTLLLALIAFVFVLEHVPAAYRGYGKAFVLWEVLAALVIISGATFNMAWGFITLRPMVVVMVGCGMSGWLIPMGFWGFGLWMEEQRYLEAMGRNAPDFKKRRIKLPHTFPPTASPETSAVPRTQ